MEKLSNEQLETEIICFEQTPRFAPSDLALVDGTPILVGTGDLGTGVIEILGGIYSLDKAFKSEDSIILGRMK